MSNNERTDDPAILGRGVNVADVAVLIPTMGRLQIKTCIDHLATGSTVPTELIVVDQSSNPEIEAIVERSAPDATEVRYIASERTGKSAALNDGLARVTASAVAIVDDDCRPRSDWVAVVASSLADSPGEVLTGQVHPETETHVPSSFTSGLAIRHEKPLVSRDVLYGGNMATSTETMRRVGPFDERSSVRNAEDNDWGYRALRLGIPITHVPDMVVTHAAWRDDDELADVYRGYAKSQGGLYGKYIRNGDAFMALRAVHDLGRGPWVWGRGIIQRDRALRIIGVAYIKHLLPGIVSGFAAARREG